MRILLSKKSIAKVVLLMLLSLNIVAGMTVLVNAPAIKDPTVRLTGNGSVELTWKSTKSDIYVSDGSLEAFPNLGGLNTVTFIPTRGWHIDAVSIDGDPQEILDEDWFSLTGVKIRNLIYAEFAANAGEDDVETGSNVESYPTPEVFLIFNNVLESGLAYAFTYSGVEIYIPPDPQLNEPWDVTTTAIFDPGVTVILVVSLASLPADVDPLDLRLLSAEVEVARADVNIDGVVDGDDVSDVANANPSDVVPGGWNERFNQNPDSVINDEDVNIVNNYTGESVWEDVTLEVVVDDDLELVYVYGVTDHLSFFGIHK